MRKYGSPPELLGKLDLECDELCFVQYIPINMFGVTRVPNNLEWTKEFVELVQEYLFSRNLKFKYLYLTAKKVPTNCSNRGGWHSDGFMTEDLNFIWYDHSPTEFAIQEFNLTQDHHISMNEMEEQADEVCINTFPSGSVIAMDQYVIHRVNPTPNQRHIFRTFVKISASNEKYNLKGNAHNYLFDYNWDMQERSAERNHPTK